MKRNQFDNFDRNFNRMQTIFWVMFTIVGLAILTLWGVTGYLVVTKGPETVERAERLIDAVTDRIEKDKQ